MFSGDPRRQEASISGGSAGRSSHDHSPNSASQMRVNTRVRSMPPWSTDELGRGLAMCGGVGRVAGQPQRDVGLDRGGQVGRAAVERGPGAVGALLASGSTRPPPAVSSGVERCRGTGAAAGPRRPSSRWSRARPSTSRPRACSPDRCATAPPRPRRRPPGWPPVGDPGAESAAGSAPPGSPAAAGAVAVMPTGSSSERASSTSSAAAPGSTGASASACSASATLAPASARPSPGRRPPRSGRRPRSSARSSVGRARAGWRAARRSSAGGRPPVASAAATGSVFFAGAGRARPACR